VRFHCSTFSSFSLFRPFDEFLSDVVVATDLAVQDEQAPGALPVFPLPLPNSIRSVSRRCRQLEPETDVTGISQPCCSGSNSAVLWEAQAGDRM